ncbi:XRE family transcriptional regulator [Alphaproteobacteria bacterium]|jgi:transcriptional regulator with XRE-family HTH domain|nr:XRE family transcriptional regulator [Alphaproteobacteria bacterium]|tara:strand:- start:104 stop:685 length:582 start_codon:yes stop_codon:yes gene_type:complete
MTDKQVLQLGNRLSSLRKRKNMTLDDLSAKSGVSKSILSQIERDLSNPTVTTISRISDALGEKLSDFFLKIEAGEVNSIESSKETPSITSKDGLCELNILGAGETVNWLQWYLLEMKPKGELDSKSHGPKTFENLTVIDGQIEVTCGPSKEKLTKGDTFRFQSNKEHTIKNISKQKAQVLMVNYIDPVNGSFN